MSDWISIERKKCNNCNVCVLRCPLVFRKKGDEIEAHADEGSCNLCGHCVALCPTDAIFHHKMDMENFEKIDYPVRIAPDQFIKFIRQRRSHRLFKNKPIPKDDLAKLIDTCRYTPTGSNVQTVEVIIVQDPDKIQRYSDLTIDFFDEVGGKAEKQIEELEAKGKEIPRDLRDMESTLQYRKRLLLARKIGFDPIFYKAPAVIIFHSPARTSTPKDNCVIASTTLNLLARTMGLEATFIGLFEAAARGYEPLQEELALPPGNKVYSALVIGYPKFKFLKTTDRKPIETRWE